MTTTLTVRPGASPGSAPALRLSTDAVGQALAVSLPLDADLVIEGEGGGAIRLLQPDRRIELARTAPLTGDLLLALDTALDGGRRRPRLDLRTDGDATPLDDGLAWCHLDFRGDLARARLVEAADPAAAAALTASVVGRLPDTEGLRVVEGRLRAAAEDEAGARRCFDAELRLFETSYRALHGLAALLARQVHRHEALELLERALTLHPDHLDSLLLTADLLLAGGREAAVPFLARAWRVCGALAPRHVHDILTRRCRSDLLPAVRRLAHDDALTATDEGGPVPEAKDS